MSAQYSCIDTGTAGRAGAEHETSRRMDAIHQSLLETVQEHGLKITDEWFAQLLDERDPLKHFKEQFHVPTKAEALERACGW